MSFTVKHLIKLTDKLSGFVTQNANQKLLVLIYHQVFKERNPYFPNEPDVRIFDQQMSIIDESFNAIPLSEGLALMAENKLPPKSVAITFDDGYRNCLENAVPILKKYGLPATLFIPTDAMNEGVMWNDKLFQIIHKTQSKQLVLDQNRTFKLGSVRQKMAAYHSLNTELKFMLPADRNAYIQRLSSLLNVNTYKRVIMTPEEVLLMSEDNFEIGSHSKTHPIFSMLDADKAKQEFLESHASLSALLQKDVSLFAYPNGKFERDFNEQTLETISQTPYQYAVTTNWGIVTQSTNMLKIPRFTPWDNTRLKFYLRLLSRFVFPLSIVNKDIEK